MKKIHFSLKNDQFETSYEQLERKDFNKWIIKLVKDITHDPEEYFGENEVARDSVIVPVTVGGDNDSTALDTVAYDTTYI